MRVVGYDPDCDGHLMARLEMLDLDSIPTDEPSEEYRECDMMTARSYGLSTNRGLYPSSGLVVSAANIAEILEQLEK